MLQLLRACKGQVVGKDVCISRIIRWKAKVAASRAT